MKTARIEFSELKMHAVFTRKKSNFLANMTGNSRQVILPREMVKLFLVNAAANHIPRSDRCVPKNSGIVFTRRTYRGSVCETELLKRQTSSVLLIYFGLPFQRSCEILQFLGQDPFYDTASPCQTSSCITAFRRIFLISGDINGILWNK